jgi:transposase
MPKWSILSKETTMDIIFPACAGLDVHQKTVVACRIYQDQTGKLHTDKQTFSTMTRDLFRLSDWLAEAQITHVAMESTGDYWKSPYNILEGNFEIWVVNAHHVKNVPGRKTDVKDAQWLADLMRHGLLQPSFIPAVDQRQWRDLTRLRLTFVRERATLCNRLHKALESANIKIGVVVSDLLGVSSRKILRQLIAQENPEPSALADLAIGTLRKKQDDLTLALEGRMNDHHRFVLGQLLDHVEILDARIAALELRIEAKSAPFAEAVAVADTIPGVSTTAAHALISEIGVDMSRFRTAAHLASWLGLCPGNNQSGGKRLSGRTRHGNVYARAVLVQVAQVVSKISTTQYSALYRRIASRRGKKRALIAVAHAVVVTLWHLLDKKVAYQEPGPDYLQKQNPERELASLQRRAAALGLTVVPVAAAA